MQITNLMEPPIEPSIEDCCNSGCNPCIFDVYERQLKIYRNVNKTNEIPEFSGKNLISQLAYTTFTLVSTFKLSGSLKVLRLKRTDHNDIHIWWNPGDHFLYKYIGENLSCTRAYTPMKLKSQKNEDFDFSIIIKCYEKGLVSRHLFDLQEGDTTLWRGPYGSYKIKPNMFKRIIMVAQGTGIAPFMSIIESILNNEEDMSIVKLYYCCNTINEILFRQEFNLYRSYWNFSYEIFLTCIPTNTNFGYQEPINTRKFCIADLNIIKPYVNDQFLICGSTKFMQHYADHLKMEGVPLNNVITF